MGMGIQADAVPPPILPAGKGSYVLVIALAEDARLQVGRLGVFNFPAGLYLYTGSAMGGLAARIRRHLRPDKKLHWHVDYLTGASATRASATGAPATGSAAGSVVEAWWALGQARLECLWAEAIATLGGQVVAPGFGSSDCRCPTHLLWVAGGNALDDLRSMLLDSMLLDSMLLDSMLLDSMLLEGAAGEECGVWVVDGGAGAGGSSQRGKASGSSFNQASTKRASAAVGTDVGEEAPPPTPSSSF